MNNAEARHGPDTKADTKIGARLLQMITPVQVRASLIPNDPVLDNALFPQLDPIKDNFETILAELGDVLKFKDVIPGFEEVSPDQARIAQNKNWKTFFLYGFGQRVDQNAKIAPKTTQLLEQIPNLRLAMFSILQPGYHIPAHVGVTKGILRCQMGLIVPKDREGCRIRIGSIVKTWAPGELFVFDDTFEHEVWNETDEERVVLLFDFDRPMRWQGRLINWLLLKIVQVTSFYRVPKRNMAEIGSRLEERIKAAEKALEDGHF